MGTISRLPFNVGALVSQKPVRDKKNKIMPTDDAIREIPRASCGEYELSKKEISQLRSRIYSINKENVVGMRFRTLVDGRLLLVWRIR